jgi:hypothetical protein
VIFRIHLDLPQARIENFLSGYFTRLVTIVNNQEPIGLHQPLELGKEFGWLADGEEHVGSLWVWYQL